jgi:rifampicin phosphotransferase
MILLKDSQAEEARKYTLGGKAGNLFHLKAFGLNVPKWMVIPQEWLSEQIPEGLKEADSLALQSFIQALEMPDILLNEAADYFPGVRFFAVRSSGSDEDGAEFSFAGQFESELFVSLANLKEKVKTVWASAYSDRVMAYRKNNKLGKSSGISIIIQEMVDADVAGVAFGINPATGDRKARLISAVYGLGEGLVSGELNADNYIITDGNIQEEITEKTHKIILNSEDSGGTRMVEVSEAERKKPSLSRELTLEIAEIINRCNKAYNRPQDLEFAIKNGQVYLLQARPVTSLGKIPDTKNGAYILWDNSNIIESYPGVTTPLTFSFISKSYEGAYKMFCSFMGVDDTVIKQNERVFANTLGFINGRVYYNLKTWYHMLAMLPGYSINARFMEVMMGVKEKFDIPDSYRLSKGKAWWSMVKMLLKMVARLYALPKKRKQFLKLLNTTIAEYKSIDFSKKNPNELMKLYLDFESRLLNEWKAPLLNDFFAMIWFGLLQKLCAKYQISTNPNIHNNLLCGSSDIISTQPIHRTIALASEISSRPELKTLFVSEDADAIWKALKASKNPDFRAILGGIEIYIHDFGERCIGELKLESISYTQEPARFVKVLKSYVENGITKDAASGKVEEELRSSAEADLRNALRFKPLKKLVLNFTLKKARELVSNRENLRYERTRAFGIVREIFSHIGSCFYAEGILDSPRDIFYLRHEEIFCYIEGRAITQDIKKLVAFRKEEFKTYQSQQPPSERFASYGPVYHANDFYATGKIEKIDGDLKGIGCCPGRVKARVRVVLDPNETDSMNGDILVTSSTDPGWVTLFPSASAIIVERGSLLSHSAIVSREMGIPCIVGVTGLLKTLKTGDIVEMDGSTGEIKIIESHE